MSNLPSIGQLIAKIEHGDGVAFIQIEDINSINFLYGKQMQLNMTYGDVFYDVTEDVFMDLVTKWKKYKEEVKAFVLSQMEG